MLFAATLHSSNVAALTIDFDYRYDTSGFFTNISTGDAITERRDALELAASFYSGFTDQLTAISSGGSNSWSVDIFNPGLLGSSVTLVNEEIAADTIKIFVGGSSSAPGVLGFAGTGTVSATGSSEFVDSVITRGQNDGDYGIWGGSIWFNTNHDWYFDEDSSGLISGLSDFLTTATHEIGHILGFGTADSWYDQIDNGYFMGENSVESYGGLVPVDRFGSHWAEGVTSVFDSILQETMMDPSTPSGTRQLPTELDYAGFSDIGWEVNNVSAVPLPAGIWLLFSGLSSFFYMRKQGQASSKT
ncbi:MAG: PEP-CTERM sorting domain-containing protein [Methylophaga sp.]|nr:MAG: PEP-CTERM sorting domain-containing protein [Methylophaga sp.]